MKEVKAPARCGNLRGGEILRAAGLRSWETSKMIGYFGRAMPGQGPVQPALGDPAWAGGWTG